MTRATFFCVLVEMITVGTSHLLLLLQFSHAAFVPASFGKSALLSFRYKCRERSLDIPRSICKLCSIFHDEVSPRAMHPHKRVIGVIAVEVKDFYRTNESCRMSHDSTNSTRRPVFAPRITIDISHQKPCPECQRHIIDCAL